MSPAVENRWSIDVLTLFPQWFDWLTQCRPVRNVMEAGAVELVMHDMRAHTPLSHGQVDDMPYGGGPGMVLRVDALVAALEAIYGVPVQQLRSERRVVVLSPAGQQFDDAMAERWVRERMPLTLLCGRYEGFDHRVHEHVATEEVSIGPYVLSGGEPAAMVMLDALLRKLPGALGNAESLSDESFSAGLEGGLEYPHYTRPEQFRGWSVPQILLSGNHARIEQWRREQAQARTLPDSDTIRG